MNKDDLEFLTKIKNNPDLKKRFEEILNIAENTSGELITAQQAEEKAIEEVRKLGQEVLKGWAKSQHDKVIENAKAEDCRARNHVKKNFTGNQHLGE